MDLLCLRTILLATDLDERSEAAAATALRLGKAAGATVHAIHVTDSNGGAPGGSANPVASLNATAAFLERAGYGVGDARVYIDVGDPASCIREHADRIRADVIVLGRHRERGEEENAGGLGGTALAVVTNAFAPCLVAPQLLKLPLENVLVPVDLSDTARGAMLVALSWASALRVGAGTPELAGTTLTALHVMESSGGSEDTGYVSPALERELARAREDAGSWAGVLLRGVSVFGADVTGAIIEHARAQRADLVVLGTRGLGIDKIGRLGSVAGRVSRAATCPVLLVPPALWTSLSIDG